jgi:hypothetical protein
MRTIEITDEVYEKIKGYLVTDIKLSAYADMIGEKWFIRTITYHLIGEVTGIMGSFLVLKDASWVADSGRFMHTIKDGTLNEVEPVGDAIVNIESITDAFPWRHECPRLQK